MNTGCEFYANALVDRAAGRLETERGEWLDGHLADCADCAASLRALEALKGAPLEVPAGLEARVRAAVRHASAPSPAAEVGIRAAAGASWRAWALPLAAAAALAGIWLGVGGPDAGVGNGTEVAAFAMDDTDPYGAWPADGLIVAGDPVLSELSVEELEQLLEELES
jgi:anti-sigma factor RsiW